MLIGRNRKNGGMAARAGLAALSIAALVAAGVAAADGTTPDAAPKEAKTAQGHCEKTVDGKEVDVDAPAGTENPKKWCKEQGGKWHKGAKHDHHD
jgi:hypothetical protein